MNNTPLPTPISRRAFIAGAASLPLAGALGCSSLAAIASGGTTSRILFTSQGKIGITHADGSALRYLELNAPNQATWQPCGFFSDGRRILLLSMEPRRDGPGRPFDEYYTQTPTHIWTYDLDTAELIEVATKDRMAVFTTPQLMLGDDRLLVQVVKDRVGKIYRINLDGSDPREFTRDGDGFPYGLSLSPDGKRVAFHLSQNGGYEVWTSDLDGGARARVAAADGHIFFGTSWSPDGQSILYVDCTPASDPGHDWCDVCVGRADGSDHHVATSGMAMWFAATYGDAKTRGGGSNAPAWTPDGRILFPRRLPGSKVAWEFQADRPDTDHFNRDYKPAAAKGGTQVCLLDPRDGSIEALTSPGENVWDFRASMSPDGRKIAFCRAATGGAPALWTMNVDGSHPRELTRGREDLGLDHPRWTPTKKS